MMSLARSAVARQASRCCVRSIRPALPNMSLINRSFSSSSNDPNTYDNTPVFDNFTVSPPPELTTEMAEGIADATQFYIKYGISNQRLRAIAQDDTMQVVVKWQKMMEVFLTTQVHVIAGMGYSADEQGLTKYAQDLGQCIQNADETMRELFTEIRRDTWRELVATCFNVEASDIPTLEIVEARNLMHKVSARMIEPEVLQSPRSIKYCRMSLSITCTWVAVPAWWKSLALDPVLPATPSCSAP